MINWNIDLNAAQLIAEIASRAMALAAANDIEYPVREATMDLTAVHLNGNPLDLNGLLNSKESDFGHDIFGIRRYLNRTTGQLRESFTPRHSAATAGGDR